MGESILNSTKKVLGLEPEYKAFDPDIIMHINSTFFNLQQIGIGPEAGFSINDESETWEDFIGDEKNRSAVKTYMYLKVRLIFDPPSTSFVITAMEKQIEQFEWRLNVQVEGEKYPLLLVENTAP